MTKFSEVPPITEDQISLDDPIFILDESATSGSQSGPGGTVKGIPNAKLLGRPTKVRDINNMPPSDDPLKIRVAKYLNDLTASPNNIINSDQLFSTFFSYDGQLPLRRIYYKNLKGHGTYGSGGSITYGFNGSTEDIGLAQFEIIDQIIYANTTTVSDVNGVVSNLNSLSPAIDIQSFDNLLTYQVGGQATIYEYTGGNTLIGSTETPISSNDLQVFDGVVTDLTPDDVEPPAQADQVPVDGTPEFHSLPQGDETVFGWLTGNDKSWGWLLQQYGIEGTFGGYYESINGAGTNLFNSQGSQVSGNLYLVRDASFDINVTTGFGLYKYLGTTEGDLTDYELQNPIKTNLSEFTDDIGATEPLVPFTAFVDFQDGDNSTATLGNPNKPFQTIDAVFALYTGENPTVFVDIVLVRQGTYPINSGNNAYFNWRIRSGYICTIDLSNNENTSFYFASNGVMDYSTTFEIPLGTIRNERNGGTGVAFSSEGTLLTINAKELYSNQSNDFVRSGLGLDVSRLKTLRTSNRISRNTPQVGEVKLDDLELLGTVLNLFEGFNELKLFKITGPGRLGFQSGYKRVIIGDYLASGAMWFVYSTSFNGTVEFQNSTITNGIDLGGQTTGNITFTGVIKSTKFLGGGVAGVNSKITFDNLSVKEYTTVNRILLRDNSSLSVINSNLNLNGFLAEYSGSGVGTVVLSGSVIKQENPSYLVETPSNGSGVVNLQVGGLETNALSLGNNKYTIVDYNLISFKDKSREIVVRSKVDIINKDLDPSLTYIIDGQIELLAGEYIEVPAGGNLTLNGYGLEASEIVKNVAGESIFTSPAGGSGGLLMDGIKFTMGTPTTSCFALTDATGFNAVEFVKTNFEGSGTIGYLDGYRQSLWTNIGVFGLSDGLEFRNNWIGGFRSETVIVRALSGTGTLFKAGTGLVFGSRFFSNANIDLPAGWAISDMSPANFAKDNLFQLKGMIITRAGDINATDTGYFPNINETVDESIWRDNVGIRNTYIGGLWEITTEAVTTINTAGTYERVSGTTTYSDLQHFSSGGGFNNTLTSTGSLTKDVSVRIQGVIDGNAGSEVSLRLRIFDRSASTYVDYNPVTQTINNSLGGDDITNFSYEWRVFDLADDDRVEIWATTANGTNVTALNGFQLFVNERR